MWPGHEKFVNSPHPIISFLKKVPPLTDQNEMREQEMFGPVLPVDPSLAVASWMVPAPTSFTAEQVPHIYAACCYVLRCIQSKSPICFTLMFTGLAIDYAVSWSIP